MGGQERQWEDRGGNCRRRKEGETGERLDVEAVGRIDASSLTKLQCALLGEYVHVRYVRR